MSEFGPRWLGCPRSGRGARGRALGPLVGRREVGAVAASFPIDQMMIDGWFLSRSTIRCDAVQVGRRPRRVVGQPVLRIRAEAVALDVRFVDEVEAVPVAQVVPLRVVRVVRRAHGVHVVLLHQLDVAHHHGAVERAARVTARARGG